MRLKLLMYLFVVAAISLSACTLVIDPSQIQTEVMTEPSPTPLVIETAADVPRISAEEAKEHFDNGTALFVDSRTSGDYERRHIKGALPNVAVPPIASSTEALDAALDGKELIITYCT